MTAALLGQVFTPAAVADLTLALALEGARPGATVLDPACGDGVFLARARAAGVPAARLRGVDVDPIAAGAARARVPGADVQIADFLAVPVREADVVVGNPPYVRQELLGGAKGAHAAGMADDWPNGPALGKRADLAALFVARALRFTRPGGRLALVLSAAALDAGYGEALRGFLAGRARLLAVIASPRERWFADAAVNAVIVVLERGSAEGAPPARFARLRVPVAEAAARVGGLADLSTVAEVRELPADRIWTTSWSPLLRAPAAWWDVAGAGVTVPLGDLADVRRGATSGANELFYLTRAEAARRRIEARFLVPVLRSPRQASAIRIDPAALPHLAFVCPLTADELRRQPGASAWVRSHATLATRPTLAARPLWWSLPARPARLFLTKAYDVRFVQPITAVPLLADQRVYAVEPRRGVSRELLGAILNGTLTALALESLGRASMGQGALEWSVADAAQLPVLDPRGYSPAAARAVARAFTHVAGRVIGPVAAEARAPDRRALDQALLAPFSALRPLLDEVTAALVATVAERRARAQSVNMG